MPYLNSTAIARAEYDEKTRTLSIWFRDSGGPYEFYGVPRAVYEGLIRAISPGTYYNMHIRDRYRSNR
jgi:hypothetical protein